MLDDYELSDAIVFIDETEIPQPSVHLRDLFIRQRLCITNGLVSAEDIAQYRDPLTGADFEAMLSMSMAVDGPYHNGMSYFSRFSIETRLENGWLSDLSIGVHESEFLLPSELRGIYGYSREHFLDWDCHALTFALAGLSIDPNKLLFITETVQANGKKIRRLERGEQLLLGDNLFLFNRYRQGSRAIHSCTYLAQDVVLSKNGGFAVSVCYPQRFMNIETIYDGIPPAQYDAGYRNLASRELLVFRATQ